MKIVYLLIDEDVSKDNGVVKKVQSQTKIWKKMGHRVKIISLRSKSLKSVIEDTTILSMFSKKNNSLQNIWQQIQNIKALDNHLSVINPDIIYTRQLKYYPGIIKTLKKYAPYIVEINSDDIEEKKCASKLRIIINKLTRNIVLSNAKAFVSVSNELMKKDNFSKFEKPFVVIGNGYAFESIMKYKKEFNQKTELVFIGSPRQSWHGVDKILLLAKNLPECILHIIGPSADEVMAMDPNLSKNIIVHGYLNQDSANKLVVQCDVGISTLALHRNNMNEASPLKSRQYLAQGLPIIIGYEDTDFLDGAAFILNIGNYDNNISDHIDEIKNFINMIKKIKPDIIREQSRTILDYTYKEKLRINFFQTFIGEESYDK
jgi:hypothetical protein